MDALYQNALLFAIGWAILHSFWQLALIWMTFQVLFGFRKNGSPDLRYIGAVALLGIGGLLFLLTGLYEYQHALAMGPMLHELAITASNTSGVHDQVPIGDRITNSLERFMPYLSSAYLIVLFFMAARLWNAWLQTRDIRKNGLTPSNEPWTNDIRDIARQLGLGHVGIYLSDRVQVPVTLGHLRPLILLPVAALNYLTVDQARAVLLHEIAHIRRRDYLVNIGVSVIGTLLFFNPFVHALSASLRRDREMCCDDFVLRCRQDAGDYARALMSLEQFRIGLSPAMVMAATGTKGQLLNRVKRILEVNHGKAAYGQRLFAFLFLAIMLSTLAWMAPDALNGPGMEHQVSQNHSTVLSGNTTLHLSSAGLTKEVSVNVSKPARSRNDLARGEEKHDLARIEDQPSREIFNDIPELQRALPPSVPVGPEIAFAPFPGQEAKEGPTVFDLITPAAPFMSFSPAPRSRSGQVDLPSMVNISPEGRDMMEALVSGAIKTEVEKKINMVKGSRIDKKYLDKQNAELAELQRSMAEFQWGKMDKRSKDWQKRAKEFESMARSLQSDRRMDAGDMLKEFGIPDPEAPARVMDISDDYHFSWSNDDQESPVRMGTTKARTRTVISGTPAPPDPHIMTFLGPQVSVTEYPATVESRVIKGVRSTGAGKKGVKIIVVEQEPRNIEIHLEQ